MKKWHFVILVSVVPLLILSMAGCHSANSQHEVTKASFGYPGMKMPPGYYVEMQKMRDQQAAQNAQAQAAQANQAAAPAPKP